MLAATPAVAQDAPPATAGGDDDEPIIVTGSRIARAGFDTLQPAVVLGDEQLQERAATNIADILNEQAAFGVPGASPTAIQAQAGGAGAAISVGQNFVNLFGLGSQRTLTLVNGRRFVSSNTPSINGPASPGVQVDLNAIPTALVDRIETIAVGGAPIYGADAIAGTVNVILKRDFQGLELNALAGISELADAARYRLQAVYGMDFADGRGNVALNVEYARQDPLIQTERPSTALQEVFLAPAPGTSRFSQVYVTDARVANLNLNGLPLRNRNQPTAAGTSGLRNAAGQLVRFAPNGDLVPYDIGTRLGSPTIFSGGEGLDLASMQTLVARTDRYLANLFLDYEFSPAIRLHGEGWFARTDGFEPVNQSIHAAVGFRSADETDTFVRNGTIPVRLDNPFLTDQARQILSRALDANNDGQPDNILNLDGLPGPDTPGFYLARPLFDLLDNYPTRTRQDLYRGLIGFDGEVDLGGRRFRWDVAYAYGRTIGTAVNPAIVLANYNQALDAVRDANGNIVCRNPANGCAPLNLFGFGAPSRAARDFVVDEARVRSEVSQHLLSANISGTVLTLPGGDVGVAAGAEYRREASSFTGNDLATSGRALATLFAPIAGRFSSREVYAEAVIPLVGPDMDVPAVHRLEFEGAARYVDNSLAGGDLTWTAGGRYAPVRDITFRGNFTRSIRAPAITELFLPRVDSRSTATDPCDTRFLTQSLFPERRAANCAAAGITQPFSSSISNALQPITVEGDLNLRNERADAWTIGFVAQPRFLPGFTVAVDWVDIRLTDAIFNLNATLILQSCYDSADFPNAASCQRFTRGPDGQITSMRTGYTNAGFLDFAGLTAELSYRLPLGRAGTLSLSANYFYLDHSDLSVTGSDLTEVAGTIGSSRHTANAFLNWTKGPFSWFWNVQYQSGAVFSNADTPTTRDIKGISASWMFNTGIAYDVDNRLRLQLNIDNVFDLDPPDFSIQAHGTGGLGGIATYYPHVIGRYFTVSARMRF